MCYATWRKEWIPIDTTRLRYFVEAASCGSFTEAARRQYTSQPNISKQIAALEEELDAKLFIRENRRVCLTEAGKYLYEQMKDLPSALDRIFDTTRALGRSSARELTIGLLAGQSLNTDMISRFRCVGDCWPDLRFSLERAGFTALRDSLDSFRFDMILTLSFDIEPRKDWIIESLKKQELALFISHMNPFSATDDLSRMPFIAISPKESYAGYQQLMHFGEKNGFEPNVVRLADSLDSLLFYVESGVGAAVLDRNNRLESDRNIRVIPVPDSEAPDLVAVWRRDNANPNIQKVADCLKLGKIK